MHTGVVNLSDATSGVRSLLESTITVECRERNALNGLLSTLASIERHASSSTGDDVAMLSAASLPALGHTDATEMSSNVPCEVSVEGVTRALLADASLVRALREAQLALKPLERLNRDAQIAAAVITALISCPTQGARGMTCRRVGISAFLALSMIVSLVCSLRGSDAVAAYAFQVICNASKAAAWMSNNIVRTKLKIDFGSSFGGLCKTFLFTALPFVIPEYFLNFASMYKARAAGMTLPFLLNFGLIVDKVVQYLLAWLSGEVPSRGDWLALAAIVGAVLFGAWIDSQT